MKKQARRDDGFGKEGEKRRQMKDKIFRLGKLKQKKTMEAADETKTMRRHPKKVSRNNQ